MFCSIWIQRWQCWSTVNTCWEQTKGKSFIRPWSSWITISDPFQRFRCLDSIFLWISCDTCGWCGSICSLPVILRLPWSFVLSPPSHLGGRSKLAPLWTNLGQLLKTKADKDIMSAVVACTVFTSAMGKDPIISKVWKTPEFKESQIKQSREFGSPRVGCIRWLDYNTNSTTHNNVFTSNLNVMNFVTENRSRGFPRTFYWYCFSQQFWFCAALLAGAWL